MELDNRCLLHSYTTFTQMTSEIQKMVVAGVFWQVNRLNLQWVCFVPRVVGGTHQREPTTLFAPVHAVVVVVLLCAGISLVLSAPQGSSDIQSSGGILESGGAAAPSSPLIISASAEAQLAPAK